MNEDNKKSRGASIFYDPVNDTYRVVEPEEKKYNINVKGEGDDEEEVEIPPIIEPSEEEYRKPFYPSSEYMDMGKEEPKPSLFSKLTAKFKAFIDASEENNERDALSGEEHVVLTRGHLKEYETAVIVILGLIMVAAAYFGSSPAMVTGVMLVGLAIMCIPAFISAAKSLMAGKLNEYCFLLIGVVFSVISAAFSISGNMFLLSAAIAVAVFNLIQKWVLNTGGKKQDYFKEALEIPPQNIKYIDDEGQWNEKSQEKITKDQNIAVGEGQIFPVDCQVLIGDGVINEKAILGEDKLEKITVGDTIFAGSLCCSEEFICRAATDFNSSLLAKRNGLLRAAEKSQGNYQKNITKLLEYFSLAFCIFALPVVVLPAMLAPQSLSKWLGQGISILVAASPAAICGFIALSYNTGVANSAKAGVIIRGFNYFEMLGQAKSFIFTKNGVLSDGCPKVNEMFFAAGVDREDVVKYVTAIEGVSDHPTAKAILKYAGKADSPPVTGVNVIEGKGISADCGNEKIICGSMRFLNENGIDTKSMPMAGTILAVDNKVLCGFSLRDFPHDGALEALNALRNMGITNISMITGDCQRAAFLVADALGIKDFKYELIPEEKASFVAKKKFNSPPAVFVGDAETDSSALSSADVGISMGFSDDEKSCCPVMILNDDISALSKAVEISRDTINGIKTGLTVFFIFKIFLIILAVLGFGNIIISVLADALISAICTSIVKKQMKP